MNTGGMSRGVPDEEIPPLLDMQLHCGIVGTVLTFLWATYVHISGQIQFTVPTFAVEAIVAILFIFAALGTSYGRNFFKDRARTVLLTCSVVCIVASALVIWLTGGAQNPFLSFYVMTFTLTLSSARKPAAPYELAAVFILPVGLAFLLYRWTTIWHPIDRCELGEFLNGDTCYAMISMGFVLTVLVASGSRLWVEKTYAHSLSANSLHSQDE